MTTVRCVSRGATATEPDHGNTRARKDRSKRFFPGYLVWFEYVGCSYAGPFYRTTPETPLQLQTAPLPSVTRHELFLVLHVFKRGADAGAEMQGPPRGRTQPSAAVAGVGASIIADRARVGIANHFI